jgi:Family of unknown function (DUF6263)
MIRYVVCLFCWLLALASCGPTYEIRLNTATLKYGKQFNYETLTQTYTKTATTETVEQETRFVTYTLVSSHADGTTDWQYRYTRIKKTEDKNGVITQLDTDSLPSETRPTNLLVSAMVGHLMTFSLSPNGTISQFKGAEQMWERIMATTTDPKIKPLLPILSQQFNDQMFAEAQAQLFNCYPVAHRRKKSKWKSKGLLPFYHIPVETEFKLLKTTPDYQVQVKRKITSTQPGNIDIGLIKTQVALTGDGVGQIALDPTSGLLHRRDLQTELKGTITVKVPFGQAVTSPILIKIKETHRLTDKF